MKPRVAGFNPKKKFASFISDEERVALAARIRYGGNPEHKRNPGDFGLTPPASPRLGKSLCDDVGVTTRSEACSILREGVLRGLVSDRRSGEFPQNIWSMTRDGHPVEAQLENSVTGTYHAYPLGRSDPFREDVSHAWRRSP